MKILSQIEDGRIKAYNVLSEITIKEYLDVAQNILKKNVFQRRKVKRTSTVYSLLRKDLRRKCTIPPIVMALTSEASQNIGRNITEESLTAAFISENVIILDGLQRTYNLIEVRNELAHEGNADEFNSFLENKIRVEFYVGLNKIGILYRMLTLNTGQTPMTTRHQIEILYSDYLDNAVDGIQFFRQTDENPIRGIGQYQFDDVIEGFNSYLERDETGIDRQDILDNITNLEKLSEENNEVDVFKSYITTYTKFVRKLDFLCDDWKYQSDDDEINNIFGRTILQIFSKVQTLSAFGAAVGRLKDNIGVTNINEFADVDMLIDQIQLGGEPDEVMMNFLKIMDQVHSSAKRIGLEQRYYLTYLLRFLFLKDEDSYLNVNKAITIAYRKYEASK